MIGIEPKKKSRFGVILAFICLIILLFICYHGAIAYNAAIEKLGIPEGIAKRGFTNEFLDNWASNLTETPLILEYNKYTLRFTIIGFVVWVLICAYYFTTRKNYISGKEFGTAKWATENDIKDLYAENIVIEEIKKYKRAQSFSARQKGLKSEKQLIVNQYRSDLKQLNKRKAAMSNTEYANELHRLASERDRCLGILPEKYAKKGIAQKKPILKE